MSRRHGRKSARTTQQSGSDSRPTVNPAERATPRRRRWPVALAAGLIVAILLLAPRLLATATRWIAARQAAAGADHTARVWLSWSGWFDSSDGRTDLAGAACLRHIEQFDQWRRAIDAARRKGAPSDAVRQELRLGLIQSGQQREGLERELVTLAEEGVPPREVAAAVIFGFLAQEKTAAARMVLDGWRAGNPDDPHVAYMSGVFWRYVAEPSQAEAEFQRALAREPRHEMARQSLAALYASEHRLEQSLAEEIVLANRRATRDAAEVRLARLLRKLGRTQDARRVLLSAGERRGMPAEIRAELGQIELDAGKYSEALAQLDSSTAGAAIPAAIGTALGGQIVRSQEAFARIDRMQVAGLRGYDLRVRLAIDSNDRQAADELAKLSSPSAALEDEALAAVAPRHETASAAALYAEHCAACHGADGGAEAVGARHLFPRARNLRTEPFQLVSIANGVATRGDIEEVLRRGMPGTAMRAFDHLAEAERALLTEEVLRLRREGLREQLAATLGEDEEEVLDEDIEAAVAVLTTPGEPIAVGPLAVATPQAIASGRALYLELGCAKCHGNEGEGDGDAREVDAWGTALLPRDLVREPFEGGHEPEPIWRRIVAGMPGTPHPACAGVSPENIADLVQFIVALGREPKLARTNHDRALRAGTFFNSAAKSP